MSLHLISHALCPYVQRAAISLTEKSVTFVGLFLHRVLAGLPVNNSHPHVTHHQQSPKRVLDDARLDI